jgi:hypothetical protein
VTVRYSPIETLAGLGLFNAAAQRVIEMTVGRRLGPPGRAFSTPMAERPPPSRSTTKPLALVESPLPCLADLALRVLEDFTDPFDGPADIRTLGVESPAAHFSQLPSELPEAHLDVAQPAVKGGRTADIAPALLGLAVCLISHDETPPRGPPTTAFPRILIFACGRARCQSQQPVAVAICGAAMSTIMQIL